MSDLGLRVKSKGFEILLQKQAEGKQRITIEELVERTPLARATVRRVLAEKDSDISGVSIQVIAECARLLGVGICDLIYVEERTP